MVNIYITDRCNRLCPDCYYPHDNKDMSSEMANDIAIWISDLCRVEKVKILKVLFLGGEPTLNQDIIFRMIGILEDNLPSPVVGHADGKYLIFTNGDYLEPSFLRRVKYRHAKILLNPTYDVLYSLESKIGRIKEVCGGCSLAIVLDEYNLPRIEALTRLALEYGCHMRINRLYDGANRSGYVGAYGEAMHKVFDLLLMADKPMWPNWIMESTYPTMCGPKNFYSCGKWLVVIDPNGSIRSCNADLDTKIGHISTHHKVLDFIFPQRWSAKNLPECQDCEFITICQGGCPLTRKLTFGTYNKRTPFCSAFKTLFPRLMQLKDKWEREIYHAI